MKASLRPREARQYNTAHLRFAFVVHPLTPKQAAKRYPVARFLPDALLEAIMKRMSPQVVSEITGVKSLTGAETSGVFIGVPLTPAMMTGKLPVEHSYATIVKAAEMAKAEGAEIIGLGAFTAVVGDGGVTIAERSPIAVTTGNSYTVATAIEGVLKASGLVGIEPCESTLAVVGATGSIGKTCARVLGRSFGKTIVVGRDPERTAAIAQEIPGSLPTTNLDDILSADAVVTVTSAGGAIVEPKHLKPGSVVCDVSRPRDVSVRVAKERPDVLVIEGGVVKVPGDVHFGLDFGFPPGTAYACMSETMMLALEERAESFTLGKDVSVEQVDQTQAWAHKHGFELAGFRSFEKEVSLESIEKVRKARG
ncbi:MAG: shikimate dehydrogenase [Armatimonadetes bacterium]|nr:shikimate dehydrogenase [Armatimonadota bacterium]